MEGKEFALIAKTFQGLEEVLAKEITALGANNVQIGRRMVSFTGDKEMMYKANFCLRTAIKILKPILHFKAKDADEVYEKTKTIKWEEYMDSTSTFLVESVVFSENFRHSKFVAYRVKDGIADYFREKTGERPNVGITNPDIRIHIHIAEDDVTICLDSSGESLHKRGYRQATVAAPLNEVLAAGMIMLTGWDGECDLIDPMCGSGTILIEAALIALNIYPGVFRKEFAFERWKDFDEELFEKIYNDDSQEREFDHKIYGYDINRQCVSIAQENARAAGVNKIVEICQQDIADFTQPAEKAIMITNPPYGERITTDDLLGLYSTLGERLKHAFAGNDAWVLSFRDECFAQIGFRPSTKYALYNGALECEFRKYQIFSGKLKDLREEGIDIKTDEERKRNLKFKPHKRRDEDEDEEMDDASMVGGKHFGKGKRKHDDNDHYFKAKPFGGKDHKRRFDDDDSRGRFGKKDDRRDRRDKRDGGSKYKDDRRRDDRKKGDNDRRKSWGFDSEGRPFRKDKDNRR